MDIEVLKRETSLAIGLVILLLGSMTIATGTYPPMVVVESGSMMHDLSLIHISEPTRPY